MSNIISDKYASSKSCYRLYAGHGNWINLSEKTTQDLLQIFRNGVPCRYALAEGLAIDIIPNDVDCNSKNIDMFGLMRADLVYESQIVEKQVQQSMSYYIRNLLDEQGIIDAFPPLRVGEDLPIITSIPTHRHLSLVPSVVGAVRRGPKPFKKANTQVESSSSSNIADSSTVTSSVTSSTSSSPRVTRKRNAYSTSSKRTATSKPRNIQMTNKVKKLQIPSDEDMNVTPVQLFGHPQAEYLGMHGSGSTKDVYPQQNQYDHAMVPISYDQGHHHMWLPFQQQHSSTRSTANNFDFEFNMDFEQQEQQQQESNRQSLTDILHEYELSQQRHFDGELYTTHAILDENHHPLPSSSDSAESYVTTSPWAQQPSWDHKSKTTAETASIDSPNNGTKFFMEKVPKLEVDNGASLILSHSDTT